MANDPPGRLGATFRASGCFGSTFRQLRLRSTHYTLEANPTQVVWPMSDSPLPADIMDSAVANFARGGGRNSIPSAHLILEVGELTPAHITAIESYVSGESGPMGVANPTIKQIRHTHHRLAQLLAGGMDETRAATMCNYSVSRVSILKSDPAFIELMAYYKSNVDAAFTDFVETAAALGQDALQEIQRRLDEAPESFTNSQMLELMRNLADRTGHAPVSKSVNININQDMADRLRSARERRALLAEATDAIEN